MPCNMCISCDTVAKAALLGSTGIFAGMGIALNLVAVPALLESKDPVPAWRVTYNRGKNIAFTCIGIIAASAGRLYFKNGDSRFLTTVLLTSVIPVWTGVMMVPTNNALFDLAPESTVEGKQLIEKWGTLQWVRTAFSVSAFAVVVSMALCRK